MKIFQDSIAAGNRAVEEAHFEITDFAGYLSGEFTFWQLVMDNISKFKIFLEAITRQLYLKTFIQHMLNITYAARYQLGGLVMLAAAYAVAGVICEHLKRQAPTP